jgi:hypothetical protein
MLRRRPEGRWQCTRCRAAFADKTAADRARFRCPGRPLVHGLLGQREHIRYPTWSKDRSCEAWNCPEPDPSHNWHGPDPYCDEITCTVCLHDCDCDVCEGHVRAPGLYRLIDSHEV